MDHAPQLGAKVKVKSWHRYYPCLGIVEKVWPIPKYDVARPDWFDPDYLPEAIGMMHERDWRVTVRPDELPNGWEFPEQDTFLPAVFEIDPA